MKVGDAVRVVNGDEMVVGWRDRAMTTRDKVYAEIDREREYQAMRWNEEQHSVTEFLVYMRDYVEEALHGLSRQPAIDCNVQALHNIRKVTALGVACMEQNGAPSRPDWKAR